MEEDWIEKYKLHPEQVNRMELAKNQSFKTNITITMLNERRWAELIRRLSGVSPPAGEFQQVVHAYSEPHRQYHNQGHVETCLAEFDAAFELADQPLELEFAIWLHDAIYDPMRSDNEERSASWALDILARSGCTQDTRETVLKLILSTKHAEKPSFRDGELMVDIDLAILGKPSEIYDLYEESIRSEYSWVPVDAYVTARSSILRGFLDRPRLYAFDHFETLYGAQARRNLSRALDSLASCAMQRR